MAVADEAAADAGQAVMIVTTDRAVPADVLEALTTGDDALEAAKGVSL